MQAHRILVTIPADHQLTVKIPDNVPAGPAEVIVLIEPREQDEAPDEDARQEALARFKAVVAELAADPRPFDELSDEEREARLRKVAGIGRGLLSSSEEFARRKQEEIDLEERHLGR